MKKIIFAVSLTGAAIAIGILAGGFLAKTTNQLKDLQESTVKISEEIQNVGTDSSSETAASAGTSAGAEAQVQTVQFRKDSYEDITWWDLISQEEFVYYEEQMKKFEEDTSYSGDGSVPPEPGINPDIDGMAVRLPGYAVGVDSVPGQFNRLKTFLFVPYQGACIHVPPPPPNQTVYVIMDRPVSTDPYLPINLEGHIYLEEGENDIAAYFYRFEGDKVTAYTDF